MTDRVLTEESEKRAKQLFDMYRERSGEHPVFVELGTCAPPTQPEEWKREITWQEDRLAVLISLAARWESVILDTTRTTLDELLLRLAPHDLPNLRHFRLSIKNDDKSRRLSEEWTPLDLRSKSPLLRRISLVYIDVRGWAPVVSDPPRSLVKFPLSRLTEFDESIKTFAGTCTIRHIRSPASGATAAIPEDTLRLEKWIGPNQISFLQYAMNRHSSHIVVLTLTISEVLYTAASAFATASYCLPLLTDLTINSAVKLPLFPFVLNTVRLSRCSLRRLTLHGFDDDEVGHLANILALSPELQHLNLKGIPAVVDLLRMQFDPTLPNAVLVPKLKTFEIEVHPGWRDSEENMKAKGHALTDMVLSRVDLVNPAHRAYVARLSAAVRTSTTSTAMRVYDQLERSVVSPDRALSTEDREVFELGTLQKWVSPLRKCVKQLGPGMNPFQGKDYDVAGRAVDNVVKAMEEYQIHGSDIRLLLVKPSRSEDWYAMLTLRPQKWQFPALLDRSLGVYGTVDIPCDEQYKITERLFALRERWKEVIAADIAASRHWMFTDVQTMIFLPADDGESRSSFTSNGSNGAHGSNSTTNGPGYSLEGSEGRTDFWVTLVGDEQCYAKGCASSWP